MRKTSLASAQNIEAAPAPLRHPALFVLRVAASISFALLLFEGVLFIFPPLVLAWYNYRLLRPRWVQPLKERLALAVGMGSLTSVPALLIALVTAVRLKFLRDR